jgi:RNA polymerase sigma-70 factor (ECF subfamily)
VTAQINDGLFLESFPLRGQSHGLRMTENYNAPGTGGEDDLALIEQVLAGNRRDFETLVRKHERRVFRVVSAILGNAEDAEEAMQDAFIKAFRHLDQFRGESKFTTWLTRIAVNEALTRRKARKQTVSLDESENVESKSLPGSCEPWASNPEKMYGKLEMRQLVEAAIQALPPIYRETLVLRDIEELSAEEAAEALGITVSALKSRLLRARLLLREALGSYFEEPRPLPTRILDSAKRLGGMMKASLSRPAGR